VDSIISCDCRNFPSPAFHPGFIDPHNNPSYLFICYQMEFGANQCLVFVGISEWILKIERHNCSCIPQVKQIDRCNIQRFALCQDACVELELRSHEMNYVDKRNMWKQKVFDFQREVNLFVYFYFCLNFGTQF
jgi:hypothetical protein